MLEHSNPGGIVAPATGFTIMTTADHTYLDKVIHISSMVAQDSSGKVVGLNDPAAQFAQIWDNIEAALADAGAALTDIVDTTTYLIGREYLIPMHEERARRVPGTPPPSTTVIVAGLPNPYHIAAIAVRAIINLDTDVDFMANHHTHAGVETENAGAHTHPVVGGVAQSAGSHLHIHETVPVP